MNERKLSFKFLKFLLYFIPLITSFNFIKTFEDFEISQEENIENEYFFLDTENLEENKPKFISADKGELYIYIDSSELTFTNSDTTPISFEVRGSAGGVAQSFTVSPSANPSFLYKIENLDPDQYKVVLDSLTIPQSSTGTVSVVYSPETAYINLKKQAVNFFVVKFKYTGFKPKDDPVKTTSGIILELANIDEASKFSQLPIKGKLRNNASGKSQDFTISFGEKKVFSDLNSKVSYSITLNGIGSAMDGIFYDSISKNTSILKAGKSENITIAYGAKRSLTDLNTVAFNVSGITGNLLTSQKIDFNESTAEYQLISNLLKSGNYYFLKDFVFVPTISAPKDYNVSYKPELINNSATTFAVTFAQKEDVSKGSINVAVASIGESSLANLKIKGKLKSSTNEIIDFTVTPGSSTKISSLDTSKTYTVLLPGIGDASIPVFYSPITSETLSVTSGNVTSASLAYVQNNGNTFGTAFELQNNNLTSELMSSQKIIFTDTDDTYQYAENNFFNGSALKTFRFLENEAVTFKIPEPFGYNVALTGNSRISNQTPFAGISFKKGSTPTPPTPETKPASINFKISPVSETSMFSMLQIAGKVKNSNDNIVKSFTAKLGDTVSVDNLSEGSVYTIELNGLGNANDSIYYAPIVYATSKLSSGINNLTINYLAKLPSTSLNKVTFNVTGDLTTQQVAAQKINFSDTDSKYVFVENILNQGDYSFVKGTITNINLIAPDGFNSNISPNKIVDVTTSVTLNFVSKNPLPTKGIINLELKNVTESTLFKDIVIKGTLSKNGSSVNSFDIKLGETKQFVNLDVTGSYKIKLVGIASSKDGIFYSPIESSDITLTAGQTKNISLQYKDKLASTSLNTVKFNVSGLPDNLLSLQKAGFLDDSSEYLFVDNALTSSNYLFKKSSKVKVTLKNVGGYALTYSPEYITNTDNFNVTYKEKEAPVVKNDKINATYWCSWGGNTSYTGAQGTVGGTFSTDYISIDQINDCYNTIVVAFVESESDKITPKFIVRDAAVAADMKEKIPQLRAKGKNIILSIGGQNAAFALSERVSQSDKDAFVNKIISIINEYGMNGLDLDIEEHTINGSSAKVFAEVTKKIVDHYRIDKGMGESFLLTMAPEWLNLIGDAGTGNKDKWYCQFIKEFGMENVSYIMFQAYNGGKSNGVRKDNSWDNRINPSEGMDNFVIQLIRLMILPVKDPNGGIVNQINLDMKYDPKKIVVGLPAANGAAGEGLFYCASSEQIKNIVTSLDKEKIQIAGFMNWSADFDAFERIVAGNELATHYPWQFGKAVSEALGMFSGPTGNYKITINVPSNSDKFTEIGNLRGYIKEENSGTVKTFMYKLGTALNLNDLSIDGEYTIYLQGIGNPKEGIYFAPVLKKKIEALEKEKTKEITVSYSSALGNDKLYSVAFSSTDITNEQLENQKISYFDTLLNSALENKTTLISSLDKLNNVYSYTVNDLTNSSYKFVKNAADVNIYLKPIGVKSVEIDNKTINEEVSTVNFAFDSSQPEPIPGGFGKINTIYYLGYSSPSPVKSLQDIPDCYNVIVYAFGTTVDKKFKLIDPKSSEVMEIGWDGKPNPLYIGATFKKLQKEGKKVLLSLGGGDLEFDLSDINKNLQIKNDLIATIDKYGFDGIDIDFEGGVLSRDGIVYGNFIKEVVDYYRNQGKEFWLTLAMEYPYLIKGVSKSDFFINFIETIGKDNFTYFWPQLYNQYEKSNGDRGPVDFAIIGNDGQRHWVGNSANCTPKDSMKGFAPQAAWAFTTPEGAAANENYKIIPFAPEKFVIGVPAHPSGAGCASSGMQAINPEDIRETWENAIALSPNISGFMAWDLNADGNNNFKYGKAVGQALGIPQPLSLGNLKINLSTINSVTLFNNIDIKGSVWNGATKVRDFTLRLGQETTILGLEAGNSYTVKLNGLGSPLDGIYYSPINLTSGNLSENQTINLAANYTVKPSNELYNSTFTVNVAGDTADSLDKQTLKFTESSNYYQLIENELKNSQIYKFVSGVTTNLSLIKPAKFSLNYTNSISSATNLTFTYTKQENPPVPTPTDPTDLNYKINATFWCSWGGNGGDWSSAGPSKPVALEDVPKCYNVVIYSFIVGKNGNRAVLYQDNNNSINHALNKPKIKNLQDEGRKVLVTIGGADAVFSIKTEEDGNLLYNDIKDIIEEYNFDGIDIDIESFTSDPRIFGNAIRRVIDYFKEKGKTLWMTGAPEWTMFRKSSQGSTFGWYGIMLEEIGIENITILWPQLYNQGSSNSVQLVTDLQTNASKNVNYPTDGFVDYDLALIEMFATDRGNEVNGGTYFRVPDGKFGIGIPSNNGAASSNANGYLLSPTQISELWKKLNDRKVPVVGFMSWSADWDALQNNNIGHKPWDTGNAIANLDGFNLTIEDSYSMTIKLNNISDKATNFSGISQIKGYITDKSTTPTTVYPFTISLDGTYKFTNLKKDHNYDVFIQGIGNPKAGVYYDVINVSNKTFKDGDILTLSYSPMSSSSLRLVPLSISGTNDSSVISSGILSFADDTDSKKDDFIYQSSSLGNGNYKFITTKKTSIKAISPAGYSISLDSAYIDSTKNSLAVKFDKISTPDPIQPDPSTPEIEDLEKTFFAFIESARPSNTDFSTWPNKNHMNVVLAFILYDAAVKKSKIWAFPSKDYVNESWSNIKNVDRLWASVGGAAAASAPWVSGSNQQKPEAFLVDLKQMIIDFGLVGLDFDIEGENNLYAGSSSEAVWTWVGSVIKLIKLDEKTKNLKLSVTLPDPLSPGFNDAEIRLLKTINRVAMGNEKTMAFDIINKMVFDWGGVNNQINCQLDSSDYTKNCYTISMLNAADDLVNNFGLSRADAISILGCTYMIAKIGPNADGCDDGGICQTVQGFKNSTSMLTAKGFKHFGCWHIAGDNGFNYWNAIHEGMYGSAPKLFLNSEAQVISDISSEKTFYGVYQKGDNERITDKINATYYPLGWGNTPTLLDIPDCYNVVICAHAVPDGSNGIKINDLKYAESNEYLFDSFLNPVLNKPNPKYIVNAIKTLQSQDRKVLISIGGENGGFQVNSQSVADSLAQSTINLIDKYGFDGIDISSYNSWFSPQYVSRNSDGKLFGSMIKQVVDHYRNKGLDFWLTGSFEYQYLIEGTNNTSFYIDFINYLGKDYFTYFAPNLHNQYDFKIKGYDNEDHWAGNPNCTVQDGMNNFAPHAIWAFTTEEGAAANTNYQIIPFPGDKFLINLPSALTGAGCQNTGINFINPEELPQVWEDAVSNSSDLAGILSWESGIDRSQGYEFGKTAAEILRIPKMISENMNLCLGFVGYDPETEVCKIENIDEIKDVNIKNSYKFWLSIGGKTKYRPWWNRKVEDFVSDLRKIVTDFPVVGLDFYLPAEDIESANLKTSYFYNWISNAIKLIKQDTIMSSMDITLSVPDDLKNGFSKNVIKLIKVVNLLVNGDENNMVFKIINKELFNWNGENNDYCDLEGGENDCHYVSMINAVNCLMDNFDLTENAAKKILGSVYMIGNFGTIADGCDSQEVCVDASELSSVTSLLNENGFNHFAIMNIASDLKYLNYSDAIENVLF